MKQIGLSLYEFDINTEVKTLIKRYLRKINFVYSITEVENIHVRDVFGTINKYMFSQKEFQQSYKIQLNIFR